jgi:signal transduction histidine kinase/HAMP domain-containing protein
MKIKYKLLFFFSLLFLIFLIFQITLINESKEILVENIGQTSIEMSQNTIGLIDRFIDQKIQEVKFISLEIEKDPILKKQGDIKYNQFYQEIIDEIDSNWIKTKPQDNLVYQNILQNDLSKKLQQKFLFITQFNQKKVFSEIFITNKYGENIAQSGPTTDYYQADETWWQKAKEKGIYVQDVEYDESSQTFSISISIKLVDDNNNFIGVMKSVLNIQEIFDIIKELEPNNLDPNFHQFHVHNSHKTMSFLLIKNNGELIYSSEDYVLFENISNKLGMVNLFDGEPSFFISKGSEEGEGEELFAHVHSNGYSNFKGLGWILVVEHETSEIFKEVKDFERRVSFFIFVFLLISVIISFLYSNSITNPLDKLLKATKKIEKGNFTTKLKIKSNDEIGMLANSFNFMASSLNESQKLIHKQNKNLEHKIIERTKDLKLSQNKLNKKIIESERAKLATLNILEDVQEAREKLKESYTKLKGLDKLKTEFLSFSSRELRTPLTPIRSQLQRLLSKDLNKMDRKESLEMILRNTIRLDKLINDVLDISRIESKRLKIIKNPENIKQLIEKIIETLSPLAKDKKVKISTDFKQIPSFLFLDKPRIQSVFINLLDNAIKHSDAKSIKISARKNDHKIEFCVEDDGKGIKKENLKKVFETFEVGMASKYKYGGAGLGLPICKGIVEAHDGKIWLTSKLNEGSKFCFTLPIENLKSTKKNEKKKLL